MDVLALPAQMVHLFDGFQKVFQKWLPNPFIVNGKHKTFLKALFNLLVQSQIHICKFPEKLHWRIFVDTSESWTERVIY